tara:strand:+ start:1498 stop:1749 length:252 start_codon:yes stop_codon:yes gene_type:complete
MAIIAKVNTPAMGEMELYIRINNSEISNHNVPSVALLRGFASGEAFNSGKSYLWEEEVSFIADVSLPLWPQIYAASGLVGQEV